MCIRDSVTTEVTQTFYNPYDETLEAKYIFPLDGTVAVVECVMLVDDKVIYADLQERALARRKYREAIDRGHRAALLEENRSETFSISVGNIPPGAGVRIRIKTIGQLHVVDSVWTLRLPLVVAPRYTSGAPRSGSSSGAGITVDTNRVPDASHVTPPVFVPDSDVLPKTKLRLSVDIDLGKLGPNVEWKDHLQSLSLIHI